MALRWGIVSAGLISSDFTTALRTLPRSEHQVVAVAARDLSRAKEFARKYDIPKAYGSYEELAKDPNVEVAYIGTQHPQHRAAVLLCLAAGKAVLCEKPMGVNAAEVREMVAEARSRGLFLMEAIWTRFFPAMEALKSAVSQGTLGELRVARAEFGKDLTHVPRAVDWAQAGGGLLDIGIYCIQFISMVFGGQKPEKIVAMGRRHETGVDDTVSVLLQYPGGVHGCFTCSITAELSNVASVSGTKGMAQVRHDRPRQGRPKCWEPWPVVTGVARCDCWSWCGQNRPLPTSLWDGFGPRLLPDRELSLPGILRPQEKPLLAVLRGQLWPLGQLPGRDLSRTKERLRWASWGPVARKKSCSKRKSLDLAPDLNCKVWTSPQATSLFPVWPGLGCGNDRGFPGLWGPELKSPSR
uniref:Trans-1,2-dihydrobenzene-1,2-diol dehydrogenase n=1 Tax=Suricata suricatta TaxID=37032 RepID=A0A673V871_SURSU